MAHFKKLYFCALEEVLSLFVYESRTHIAYIIIKYNNRDSNFFLFHLCMLLLRREKQKIKCTKISAICQLQFHMCTRCTCVQGLGSHLALIKIRKHLNYICNACKLYVLCDMCTDGIAAQDGRLLERDVIVKVSGLM